MSLRLDQIAELLSLGLDNDLLLRVVTIFERDASRDERDGKALAAARARRYRLNKQAKLGMAEPDGDTSRHAERHVTHHVMEIADPLSFFPSSLPLLVEKEESEKKEPAALVVEGRRRRPRKIASPISDDWQPNGSHFEAAAKRGVSRETVIDQADAMRQWAKSKDEHKADWDATFHGFIRRVKEQANGHRGPRALQDDRLSVSKAADRLIEQAERGQFSFGPKPSLMPPSSEDDRRLLPKG